MPPAAGFRHDVRSLSSTTGQGTGLDCTLFCLVVRDCWRMGTYLIAVNIHFVRDFEWARPPFRVCNRHYRGPVRQRRRLQMIAAMVCTTWYICSSAVCSVHTPAAEMAAGRCWPILVPCAPYHDSLSSRHDFPLADGDKVGDLGSWALVSRL